MRLLGADTWAPEPGRLWTWEVAAGDRGSPVPTAVNQSHHLAAAAAGEPAVWLAATLDVPGALEPDVVERAGRALLERHEVLTTRSTVLAGVPVSRWHNPAFVQWRRRTQQECATAEATGRLLAATLDAACAPVPVPPEGRLPMLLAAVVRADVTTVVLGLDHQYVDAASLAVLVDELAALLADPSAVLPAASSILDRPEPEAVGPDHPDGAAGAAGTDSVEDAGVRAWHAFLAFCGHRLPTFPLSLGLEPGERRPQATDVHVLLDAAATDDVGRCARAEGGGTASAVLGALADAVHACGGPDELPVLVPVDPRTDETERRSVGWWARTVPVWLAAGDDQGGTAVALKTGVALADVPLDRVLETLPVPLARERADAFSVSWLDYRHAVGGSRMRERAATHVSAATRADDLQLWLARTDDGLTLRVRRPDTDVAARTVDEVVAAWRERLVGGP